MAPEAPETPKMAIFGANKCGPGSGPNYGETAVCSLGREGNKWSKIRFLLSLVFVVVFIMKGFTW